MNHENMFLVRHNRTNSDQYHYDESTKTLILLRGGLTADIYFDVDTVITPEYCKVNSEIPLSVILGRSSVANVRNKSNIICNYNNCEVNCGDSCIIKLNQHTRLLAKNNCYIYAVYGCDIKAEHGCFINAVINNTIRCLTSCFIKTNKDNNISCMDDSIIVPLGNCKIKNTRINFSDDFDSNFFNTIVRRNETLEQIHLMDDRTIITNRDNDPGYKIV